MNPKDGKRQSRRTKTEAQLINLLLEALPPSFIVEELQRHIRVQGMPDAIIRVTTPAKHEFEFVAEINPAKQLNRIEDSIARLHRFAAETRTGMRSTLPLYIAPMIPPETCELLKSNGVNYLDFAGNCYINIEGEYNRAASVPLSRRALLTRLHNSGKRQRYE